MRILAGCSCLRPSQGSGYAVAAYHAVERQVEWGDSILIGMVRRQRDLPRLPALVRRRQRRWARRPAGLIARLDYLNGAPDSLGVDAIWISPCSPPRSGLRYDVADYTAIDPRYGSLEISTGLIAEAHRRGIRVLLDLVSTTRRTSIRGFVDARSSRTSARRDWYVWRDGRPGGVPRTTGSRSSAGKPGNGIRRRASTTTTCSCASSRI